MPEPPVDCLTTMPSHLPPEIWAQIAGHCSTKTLKALCLVCHAFCDEARRLLYRSVCFRGGIRYNFGYFHPPELVRIKNLALFYQSLGTCAGWHGAVQDVRIDWCNGIKHAYDKPPEGQETEAHLQFNSLIEDTVNLLSRFSKLRRVHLSLPRLDSAVPFRVECITSLRIPITCGQYETKAPDFALLLKLFQLPLLRSVEIDSMLVLSHVIPHYCRQPGTSNVKDLNFIDAGPISEELIDLLRWPKDLQSLEFYLIDGEDGKPVPRVEVDVSCEKMVKTVSSLKQSIQTLQISLYDMTGMPYQGGAFQEFSKLRQLRIDRHFLIEFSTDFRSDGDYDLAPSIHTQLPRSLQELHIEMNDFNWMEEADDEVSYEPTIESTEAFAFLSGLAEAKATCFPELRQLHVTQGDCSDDCPPHLQTFYYPFPCDTTWDLIDLLRESDIEVFFNGYSFTTRIDDYLLSAVPLDH